MSEHSRSIDTRHHAIRQDYVDGEMRIGGVTSQNNESDILTKYLQPPLRIKHTHQLYILKDKLENCVLTLTSNGHKGNPSASPNCPLAKQHRLTLNPPQKPTLPKNAIRTKTNSNKGDRKVVPRVASKLEEDGINNFHRCTHRQPVECLPRPLQKVVHHQNILFRSSSHTRHGPPTHQERYVNPATQELPPAFMDLIYPPHHPANRTNSQPPRFCDPTKPRADTKTRKKHRRRSKKCQ
jgi:hypothetical protein